MFLIFYVFSKNKLNKKIKILEKNNKDNFEKINNEKNNLENEINIYKNNIEQLLNEINTIKLENNLKNNLEENNLINKLFNSPSSLNTLAIGKKTNIDICIVVNNCVIIASDTEPVLAKT